MTSENVLRFVELKHSEARQENSAVFLGMVANDGKYYAFEIGSGCGALVVAALAAELGKLPQPEENVQFIHGKSLTIARSGDGDPMLLLTLESGAILSFVLRAGDLTGLIDELQILNKTLGIGRTH